MDSPPMVLATRDMSDDVSPLTYDLLLTLLALVLVIVFSAGALFALKRHRRAVKQAGLPFHNNATLVAGRPHHRRTPSSLTSPMASSQMSYYTPYPCPEEEGHAPESSPPPRYPLPEIRIHFPEETDDTGKQHAARIVAVRVGENGIGLEPVEENLPPYQKDAGDRFHSLDMERLGGLKEKEFS